MNFKFSLVFLACFLFSYLINLSAQTIPRDELIFFTANAKTFLDQKQLSEEVFGPVSLIVRVENPEEFSAVAQVLQGRQLTATIHGSRDDLSNHRKLLDILQKKAGRLIFNGFPNGVEVCASMHHGGPYPVTTDIRTNSVGTLLLNVSFALSAIRTFLKKSFCLSCGMIFPIKYVDL